MYVNEHTHRFNMHSPCVISMYNMFFKNKCFIGSSGGRVVKLLACGARGPGFNSRPRHLNFQRLVISCFQVSIWLKYRWSDVNPQYNQPTNKCFIPVAPLLCIGGCLDCHICWLGAKHWQNKELNRSLFGTKGINKLKHYIQSMYDKSHVSTT